MSSIAKHIPTMPNAIRESSWLARFLRDNRGIALAELMILLAIIAFAVTAIMSPVAKTTKTGQENTVKLIKGGAPDKKFEQGQAAGVLDI